MNTLNEKLKADENDLQNNLNTLITLFIAGVCIYPPIIYTFFDFIVNGLGFNTNFFTTLLSGSIDMSAVFLIGFTFLLSIPTIVFPISIFFRGLVYWILGREYITLLGNFIEKTSLISTSTERIDEILVLSEDIRVLISKKDRFFYSIFYGKEKMDRWDMYVVYIHGVLKDIRSDLRHNLKEQVIKLKSTKSDLKMQTNTILNNVVDLQSARLDRQIEQFEELQRVLVKI